MVLWVVMTVMPAQLRAMRTDLGSCQPRTLPQYMDKVCPPAGLQSLTAGLACTLVDKVRPLQGITVGFSVIQMDKVYPPVGLQNLAAGFSFLQSTGPYFIQMV